MKLKLKKYNKMDGMIADSFQEAKCGSGTIEQRNSDLEAHVDHLQCQIQECKNGIEKYRK
jgi:hypothetical protein